MDDIDIPIGIHVPDRGTGGGSLIHQPIAIVVLSIADLSWWNTDRGSEGFCGRKNDRAILVLKKAQDATKAEGQALADLVTKTTETIGRIIKVYA